MMGICRVRVRVRVRVKISDRVSKLFLILDDKIILYCTFKINIQITTWLKFRLATGLLKCYVIVI